MNRRDKDFQPYHAGCPCFNLGRGRAIVPRGKRLSTRNGDFQPENALRESFQHRLHERLAEPARAPEESGARAGFPDRVLRRILDRAQKSRENV